jgi:hypothetical protein
MNLEALKLELPHCLERAEEADRYVVRRQWLSAAKTWQCDHKEHCLREGGFGTS